MVKRSIIGFEHLPDITVRELTLRDLLEIELDNVDSSNEWIINEVCGAKMSLTPWHKKQILEEFERLNHQEPSEDGTTQKASEIITLLTERGHLNCLDYGLTFVRLVIETITKDSTKNKEQDENFFMENFK
jgi:hypothetical protein